MKRVFWRIGGFTTAELLVAALFGIIIMAALYGFYQEQLYSLLTQEAKIATLEDGRGALDFMVRDLRNAGSWGTGVVPSECSRVVTATPTTIRVQADLDGSGDCSSATGEDVTYDLSGATSTCPGTIIRRNGTCLVANVVIPIAGKLFSYYDRNNVDLGDNPPVSSIKRVKITFSVQVANPDPKAREVNPNVTSTLSSSVEFRN